MDILNQLFHAKEIEKIIEMNPDIKYIDKKEARNIIKLLSNNKCTNKVLRSLILRNSSFLLRKTKDIEEIINILIEYGVENVDLVFYLDPLMLNKSAYEIDNFFIKKHNEGYTNEEICNLLEVEPFRIEE